jgi:hypothetical protein
MQKGAKTIIVVAILVGAMVTAASLKLYFIREDSGGEVLWNAKEAYLFIGVDRTGFQVSSFEYPWAVLREYLNGVRPPDAVRSLGTAIRVTPSAVERHKVEDLGLFYTPLEGRIYAMCQGNLCRWSGDHFDQATEDEARRSDGINRLIARDFDNVNGWYKRGIGAGPRDIYARTTVDVGGRFTLLEKSEPIGRIGYAAVSIYVQRAGQNPETIWHLDGHPRRVSKAEYEESFARH